MLRAAQTALRGEFGKDFRVQDWRDEPGLEAGLVGGFFSGLETPKLMRKKRKPLRRESRMLIAGSFIHDTSPAQF